MKTIAIFVHQPKCSVQSANGIIRALSPDYRFKIFTRQELEDDFFDDVDMVCIPGGIGDADSYSYLMQNHEKRIKKFVADGGKYLGICMGAYWADKNYLNILDDVRVDQYIIQPNTDTRRPHAKNMPIVWEGEERTMFFYDGCTFIGNNFEVVATYKTGYPMAVMQNNIGMIGCHPESENHWYESYSWLRGKWHGGDDYKLLKSFVSTLMNT